MKVYKALSLFVGALSLFFAACEPIENRQVLSNSFDPDDIQLEVIQSTPGGNELSIRMNTPGVAGYWDYVIDRKFSDRVDVVFPIPGKSTFTFYVTTPYLEDGNINTLSYISKTVDVTITQLDHALPEAYYKLVGDNLQGKTWVFDGVGGDGRLWWYMSDPGKWNGLWWNAGGECCPPADVSGRMVFDLNGGANFTYYASPTAEKVTGTTWAFNADFTRLTLKGNANILGSMDGGGNGKVFEIKEFTANRLTLFVSNAAWATGWTWVFKPAP
ncbi:MAG: hypothetical protein QUS66_00325 [Bacteroidota bacterium]|jgi:hypothetical protein|nr:hypothetical protein [Bacteroidota bacterium]